MTPGQAAFIGYMDVMSGPNPIGHGYPASEKVMEAWEAAAKAAIEFARGTQPVADYLAEFDKAVEASRKAMEQP